MIEPLNFKRKIIIPFTEDANRIRHYINIYMRLALMIPELVIMVTDNHHYVTMPVSAFYKVENDAGTL
jgi:hypothetical protein